MNYSELVDKILKDFEISCSEASGIINQENKILEEDLNIHPGPNLLANIDETMSNSLLRTLEEKFLKYYV